MTPEPMTIASSNAVPSASTANRRPIENACSGGSRLAAARFSMSRTSARRRRAIGLFADIVEPSLQRQAVEAGERQAGEQADPIV